MVGGSGNDRSYAIAADALGEVYVSGVFSGSVDFDQGAWVDSHTAVSVDLFVTKLYGDGSYGWTQTSGGSSSAIYGFGLTADSQGTVYLTGEYFGTIDFDIGAGVDQHTSMLPTAFDLFITQLKGDGSYGWTKTLGSGSVGLGSGMGMALDNNGNLYIVGTFSCCDSIPSSMDFDPGTGTDIQNGSLYGEPFLSKYNFITQQ